MVHTDGAAVVGGEGGASDAAAAGGHLKVVGAGRCGVEDAGAVDKGKGGAE